MVIHDLKEMVTAKIKFMKQAIHVFFFFFFFWYYSFWWTLASSKIVLKHPASNFKSFSKEHIFMGWGL